MPNSNAKIYLHTEATITKTESPKLNHFFRLVQILKNSNYLESYCVELTTMACTVQIFVGFFLNGQIYEALLLKLAETICLLFEML